MNDIVLYTNHCPNCQRLKEKLDKKKIEYCVFDDVPKMIEMGFVNMPMLEANGKRMAFKQAMKWCEGDTNESED